jgi:hypothetical protein
MASRVGDSIAPNTRRCNLTLCWRWATAGVFCLCLTTFSHSAALSECSLSSVTEGIQKGIIIKRSDDPVANHAMYLERKMLLQEFHLFPTFYFMTGRGSTNACAFPEDDPDRGVVTFGEELLRKEVSDAGGPEYASSVPAIMAHEFAHLLQIKNGSTLSGPKYELQADYIAGWYIGRRAKWISMSSSPKSLQTIMRSFYAKGDYELNDPSHHGTPDERVAAISAGYRNSELRMPDIYRESLKFVSATHDSSTASGRVTPYDPLELSEVLAEVMTHQHNRFADLRGVLDEDSKATWIATIKLPNAARCVVEWRNQYQGDYTCEMATSLDQAMAEDTWKDLISDVQTEYAKGWKREDNGSGQSTSKNVVFTSPRSDDVSVKVAIAKSTLHRGYEVDIEIPFDNY